MDLTSSAFQAGRTLPDRFSCDGENISPPLQWSGVPAGAQSLVLIFDDPDAPGGMFSHWVIYDMSPEQNGLPEGIGLGENPNANYVQGRNDYGDTGYGAPCPPPGETHQYFFRLYALDTTLNIGPGATRAQVIENMEGHILATTELSAAFQRIQG